MTRVSPGGPPAGPDTARLVLVDRLRAVREQSGLTYREMAQVTGYSHTTLSRAASNSSDPASWDVCEAFVKACGGAPGDFQPLWESARHEFMHRRPPATAQHPTGDRPDPNEITSVAEFVRGLQAIRLAGGQPPYRAMARRAGFPASTLAEMFDARRRNLPKWEQVQGILLALKVSEADQHAWHQAWTRVAATFPRLRRQLSNADLDTLQRQALPLGLEGIYPTRVEALNDFAGPMEREIRNGAKGRIWLIGSSMKGMLQPIGRFDGVSLLRRAIENDCDIRILVTDPTLVDARATQEERPPAAIYNEMCLNIVEFEAVHLRREQVRYCQGAPTVFGICTSDRMLLNAYPFGSEAYKHFSLIFRKSADHDTVFARYLASHFERAWDSSHEITPRQWADILTRKQPQGRRQTRRRQSPTTTAD